MLRILAFLFIYLLIDMYDFDKDQLKLMSTFPP